VAALIPGSMLNAQCSDSKKLLVYAKAVSQVPQYRIVASVVWFACQEEKSNGAF